MKLLIIVGLIFCGFGLAETPPGCHSNLAANVPEVNISADNRLAAILIFASRSGLCLGIENPGLDLLRSPAVLEASDISVFNILRRLIASEAYQITHKDETILIQRTNPPPQPTELDTVVPEFKTGKISLAWANTGLYWRLVRLSDPSIQGIAGHLSDRVPKNLVGPFNERKQTTRELLTMIVGQSAGATWVSGPCSIPTRSGQPPCWTLLDYGEDPAVFQSLVRDLADRLREQLLAKDPAK